jgi:hypothetical protein
LIERSWGIFGLGVDDKNLCNRPWVKVNQPYSAYMEAGIHPASEIWFFQHFLRLYPEAFETQVTTFGKPEGLHSKLR